VNVRSEVSLPPFLREVDAFFVERGEQQQKVILRHLRRAHLHVVVRLRNAAVQVVHLKAKA
jgi:hypothetical protein